VRTPLHAFIALAVLSVTGLVGVSAQPAYAACSQLPQDQQISDTPWPQTLWDLNKLPGDATGAGVKVAVLDSGVDIQHPQLRDGKVADHLDLLRHLPTSEDLCGHGTAVAGLIAARRINGIAFRGIAPNALILSARVSEQVLGNEDAKPVSDAEMASAVYWAISKGAKVINISFVYTSEADIPAFKAAIQSAIAQNVVVVAAVGNNNTPEKHNPTPYPAAWPGVVGVAAMDSNGLRHPASGEGSYVDIAAPGVHVTVPRPGSGYYYGDGTSYAAPLVAGTAALIFARYPKLTGREVVQRLLATADPAPGGRRSTGYGVGVVNPVRAVTEPIDGLAPVDGKALPGPSVDPVAAGAAARTDALRERALWLGGVGVIAALLAVALMLALPAGMRRRWKPAGR
jgi:type VII secretion-associated serine protease mycosin